MSCSSCGTSNNICSCADDILTYPAGLKGDPGPQGNDGPQGDLGPTGPAGLDGSNGPVTTVKFVKDFIVLGSPGTPSSVPGVVTAAELVAAGMLKPVYNATTGTPNTAASAMDFVYQIWYQDDTVSPPLTVWTSATEGVSPKCTQVAVNTNNGIDLLFADGGGTYRLVIIG